MGSKEQDQAPQGWSPILPWCAPVLGLTRGARATPKRGLACVQWGAGAQGNTLASQRLGIFGEGHSQAAAPRHCCSPALALPGPHRKQGTNPWCHVGDKCLLSDSNARGSESWHSGRAAPQLPVSPRGTPKGWDPLVLHGLGCLLPFAGFPAWTGCSSGVLGFNQSLCIISQQDPFFLATGVWPWEMDVAAGECCMGPRCWVPAGFSAPAHVGTLLVGDPVCVLRTGNWWSCCL